MFRTAKHLKSVLVSAALMLAPAAGAGAQPSNPDADLNVLVAQFKLHGLIPVGKHGFLQTVRWVEQSVVAERSR